MEKYFKLLKDTPHAKAGALYVESGKGWLVRLNDETHPLEYFIPGIKDFNEWFEEVDKPYEPSHSLGWQPKKGEEYYYNSNNYGVVLSPNVDVGFDRGIIYRGVAKKTAKEVEQAVEIEEAKHKIWKYMREHDMFFEIDYKNKEQLKYQIMGWNYALDKPDTDYFSSHDRSQYKLIFKSGADMHKILRIFPNELKLILKRW